MVPRKNCLTFLLLACAALLFDAQAAKACSCGPKPTVLEAYDSSDVELSFPFPGCKKAI